LVLVKYFLFFDFKRLKMFHHIVNLLFPKVCVGCHNILFKNEIVLCSACRNEIPTTNHTQCFDNEALKIFYGRIDVQFAATLLYYEKKGIVKETIHALKYKGKQEVGTVLGKWMGSLLNETKGKPNFDAIIPVPIHKKRMKQRGYNQVKTFAEALSKTIDVYLDETILTKNIYKETQVRKSRYNRTNITDGVFDVDFTEKWHNKHFLIVDDVLTTGATLEACAKAILKIPGSKVSIVCMAMTKM
jgi:ComF family protein